MMKKKVIILMLVGMFCLTACGQPLNNQPKDTPIQEEQDDIDDLDNKEQEYQKQITEPKGNENDHDVT